MPIWVLSRTAAPVVPSLFHANKKVNQTLLTGLKQDEMNRVNVSQRPSGDGYRQAAAHREHHVEVNKTPGLRCFPKGRTFPQKHLCTLSFNANTSMFYDVIWSITGVKRLCVFYGMWAYLSEPAVMHTLWNPRGLFGQIRRRDMKMPGSELGQHMADQKSSVCSSVIKLQRWEHIPTKSRRAKVISY